VESRREQVLVLENTSTRHSPLTRQIIDCLRDTQLGPLQSIDIDLGMGISESVLQNYNEVELLKKRTFGDRILTDGKLFAPGFE
jgi:hypothetical protein